ncbi:MAG: hypothetical protein KIS86_05545 [Devosia sp.]|nr:hypothetical protein [Devosia sp.]
MKLTWFGNATFRVHIGGAILVVEPDGSHAAIDRTELVSGADRVVVLADIDSVDSVGWKPRAPLRPMEAEEQNRAPAIVALDADTLVIDADGEAPVVMARAALPPLGKWVEQAVVIMSGGGLAARALALVADRSPRLVVLAGSDAEIDAAFETLRERLDGTGLVALERALAVEV